MTLEDKPLINMEGLELAYAARKDKNRNITDILIAMAKDHCKQYNAFMWGLYWDKPSKYFRVQYELPKA
jgi:hypothetical protein